MRIAICLIVLGTLYTTSSQAQTEHQAYQTVRVSLGGGRTLLSNQEGLSAARVAIRFFRGNWGLTARAAAYDGEDASEERCGFGCYIPTEVFYERAIMTARRFAPSDAQFSVSIGPGLVSGRQLDPTGEFVYNFETVAGIAYEVDVSTTTRHFGVGAAWHGNVNFESGLSAISGFVYLGL